jgi:multicomponent Na+:H+ antiporter subunit E
MMKRITILTLILSGFWLLNSGHFTPLLLGFGVLSVAGVIWLIHRTESVDGRFEYPVTLSWRLPSYLIWLMIEVIKCSSKVIQQVWERDLKPSPVVFDAFMADLETEVHEVMYASSVTLTPGTAILEIDDKILEIHALTHDAARSLLKGEMARRIRYLESGKK